MVRHFTKCMHPVIKTPPCLQQACALARNLHCPLQHSPPPISPNWSVLPAHYIIRSDGSPVSLMRTECHSQGQVFAVRGRGCHRCSSTSEGRVPGFHSLGPAVWSQRQFDVLSMWGQRSQKQMSTCDVRSRFMHQELHLQLYFFLCYHFKINVFYFAYSSIYLFILFKYYF